MSPIVHHCTMSPIVHHCIISPIVHQCNMLVLFFCMQALCLLYANTMLNLSCTCTLCSSTAVMGNSFHYKVGYLYVLVCV